MHIPQTQYYYKTNVVYDESKDLTIICMCRSVSDLCVRAGVPVWVIDDDSVGSSQIDSQTSDFSSQQEDKNGFVLQERQKNHLPKKKKNNKKSWSFLQPLLLQYFQVYEQIIKYPFCGRSNKIF